jgi:activating signal cointegrator 1
MKALSLWQPWATLIAIGAKQYETRSWSTNYRGPLVIHAAKRDAELKFLKDAIDRWPHNTQSYGRSMKLAIEAIYADAGRPIGSFIPTLPLGMALCTADLVDVVRVETIRATLGERELVFGNYDDGRFAWKLANVRRFRQPLTMRGAQGLFECNITKPELYLE